MYIWQYSQRLDNLNMASSSNDVLIGGTIKTKWWQLSTLIMMTIVFSNHQPSPHRRCLAAFFDLQVAFDFLSAISLVPGAICHNQHRRLIKDNPPPHHLPPSSF